MKKKALSVCGALIGIFCVLLFVCAAKGTSLNEESWKSRQNFYKINQRQVGDYQDKKADWENSSTFRNIYLELENNYNAFICSTWNYDIIDGKPRYDSTGHGDIPIEYDYYGYSLTVSKNYFDYTLIKDVTGADVRERLTFDKNTLDILVPEKYQDDAPLLTSIYQEFMYFNNVEVENIYNEELNREINEMKEEDFTINIIYVPNDTEYDVYNPAIRHDRLKDCIGIVVNSENYNRVQLKAIATQGLYLQSNDPNIESDVQFVYRENGYEDGYHSISSVGSLYSTYRNESIAETIVIGCLSIAGISLIIGVVFFARKKINRGKNR